MARLWALMTALMSPVSPRENSVNGTHCDRPPPAAEPLIFIVGPPEGWRMQATTFLPRLPMPCSRPMVVVDFPFAQRRGRDGGDLDEFSVGPVLQPLENLEVIDLGNIVAVGEQFLLASAPALRQAGSTSSCGTRPLGRFPSPHVSSDPTPYGFFLSGSIARVIWPCVFGLGPWY